MTTFFYDANTDTVRKYGHLTAGADVGERFNKETKEWSHDCCLRAGCQWDKEITEEEAEVILARQRGAKVKKKRHNFPSLFIAKNFYTPATREITLSPDASTYVRYHELAHKEQHDTKALVYRAWLVLRYLRFAGYLATVWVEWDAHCRARRVMTTLGLWNNAAREEGKANLLSYVGLRDRE